MPNADDADERAAKELVLTGSDMAGAAVGGAIALLGGPAAVAGAAGGVVVSRVLKRVGRELIERTLGTRQSVRVGAAYAIAADEIRQRLEEGENPRDEDFFSSERPPADELLEGVLLHAADQYEERKVPILGWFYASLVFAPQIDPAYANFLLRLLERVTSRQLASLPMFGGTDDYFEQYHERLIRIGTAWQDRSLSPSYKTVAELEELARAGLIGVAQEGGGIASFQGVYGGGAITTLPLGLVRVTSMGSDLVELACLGRLRDTTETILGEIEHQG